MGCDSRIYEMLLGKWGLPWAGWLAGGEGVGAMMDVIIPSLPSLEYPRGPIIVGWLKFGSLDEQDVLPFLFFLLFPFPFFFFFSSAHLHWLSDLLSDGAWEFL